MRCAKSNPYRSFFIIKLNCFAPFNNLYPYAVTYIYGKPLYMYPKSKQRFILKVIASYSILGVLVLLAAFFIYSEFKEYDSSHNREEDHKKLLKTSALLTELYEAENLSKLVLQTKKRANLKAYARKVDSIFNSIKSIQLLTKDQGQFQKLDSIQKLLQQKVYNNAELRKLKVENTKSAPIDSLLKRFDKIAVDMGRITPETFVPNFKELPPKAKNSIREYVALLNNNIPDETDGNAPKIGIDSMLRISRSILEHAKTEKSRMERSVLVKELEIYRADMELSQKLRSMITAFEKEIIAHTYLDNLHKQEAIRRSNLLTGAAIFLGLIVVSISTFLITRDFWKVQQYRQQLEQEKKYSESLLKSREQLISTVSHDLKTPLNSISGYTELMEHGYLETKQREYIKHIKSAATYVDRLVNDLLDFSKLEAGKIQPEKIPFVLSRLITEIALDFEGLRKKKSIALRLEIEDTLEIPIVGDPFRLRQILANLLGNALKFTDKGDVEVQARTQGITANPHIEIKVLDTGIGIALEKQESIFKEFTQGGSSIEKKYGGYGLGLTIARKLTKLLDGTLHLESEKNKGSCFTLTFPLQFSDTPVSTGQSKRNHLKKPPSLLIFDDDDTLLELLGETGKTYGMRTEAFSSFEHLQKTGNFQYDIVLTDIQMPKINGFEVVKKLKCEDHKHYKGQPIIAMTGQRSIDQSVYANAGFSHVLAKPFSQQELFDAITKVMASHDFDKGVMPIHTNLFNLKGISAFVHDTEGMNEILKSFLKNTAQNMKLLSMAVEQSDYNGIKSISHKMLPMFRQLEVKNAIAILERFENLSVDVPHAKTIKSFEQLRLLVSDLKKGMSYVFDHTSN